MDFISLSVSGVAKVGDWLRLLIEMSSWPPWITAPVKATLLAGHVNNLRSNLLNELWSKNLQILEINSASLHYALSLFLVHTNCGTFLLACFQASRERSKHPLSITSHGRPERREKPIRFFLFCEWNRVSGFWLIIRYFSQVRKIVWPMGFFLIKERRFYSMSLHWVNLSTYMTIITNKYF